MAVDSGTIDKINNDHGISSDGKWIAISAGEFCPAGTRWNAQANDERQTKLFSWLVARRQDASVLRQPRRQLRHLHLPAATAAKVRLTSSPGYDDGPDYSPDGNWIYFNSDRSGSWDIWRMPSAGAGPNDEKAERVTSDDYEDWFPHPSPDGKWMVFISFEKGNKGHPADQNVMLRRMRMPGAHVQPAKLEVIKNCSAARAR